MALTESDKRSNTSGAFNFLSASDSQSWLIQKIVLAKARIALVGEQHRDYSARKYNYELVLQSMRDAYPNEKRILFLECPGNAGWVTDLEKVVNAYLRNEVPYAKVEATFAWPVYRKIPPTKELLDKAASLGFIAKCIDQINERTGDVNEYMTNQMVSSLGDTAVGVYVVGQAHLDDPGYIANTIPTLLKQREISFVSIASFEKGGVTNSNKTKEFLNHVPSSQNGVLGFVPGLRVKERNGNVDWASSYDLLLIFSSSR